MRLCRWVTWLSLPLATLSSRPLLAGELRVPLGAFRPDEAYPISVGRAAGHVPGRLMPVTWGAAEVIKPGTPLAPQQPVSVVALSLDDLERIALESNPTLVQAAMAVRAAQGDYFQAGLYPNPAIGYIADEVGNDGAAGLQGGGLSQEIVTRGKLRLGRAVAGHEVQQARYGWEMQRWRVLNDVRAGYYEVLLAQKMVEVDQQLVRIGEEAVKVTEQLRAAQEVSRADVLQARIEAEIARLGLNDAQNRHQAAWRQLASVLGRPELAPAPLAGDVIKDLPVLGWEESLTRLLTQSPELGQARAGVERARYELALQCAERVPNFEIATAVKYDDGSRYTVADVGLTLPLPLFNRNQGNIVKAQANLVAAEHEVRRIELELHDRFAAAFEQYANARRQVETYTGRILPNAQASLDLMRAGYREGEFGYLSLLTAQRTFFSVSLEYLASLRQFWAQTVEIEGMLLRGGLQAQK
jgi:cobalt-zinc-cadmium efflux system outer membrane protein